MLAKLLDRFRSANAADGAAEDTAPDISRVIKLSPTPAPTANSSPATKLVDPDQLGDLAEQGVDDLSTQFETWMQADLDQLYLAWNACRTEGARPDDFRILFTAAHNIRGVASSYGYPAISRLCGSLCNLLTSSPGNPPMDMLKLHVDSCRAAHAQSGTSDTSHSVADALCDALERKVAIGLAT